MFVNYKIIYEENLSYEEIVYFIFRIKSEAVRYMVQFNGLGRKMSEANFETKSKKFYQNKRKCKQMLNH